MFHKQNLSNGLVLRDFKEKLNFDKEQKFKSEDDALAFYKDTVKKINQKLFMIIPRDLITAKGTPIESSIRNLKILTF